MKHIIIGCPRNGSTFISNALKINGLEVGHEKYKKDGISSWVLAGENDNTPWGPSLNEVINKIGNSDYTIHHQIREPLSTISSITTISDKSWEYISKFVDLSQTNSSLHKSMLFWYEWNLRCESITNKRYKLIDYKQYFNLEYDYENTKVNSRKHTFYKLEDLFMEDKELCEKIIKMSQKYGYEI